MFTEVVPAVSAHLLSAKRIPPLARPGAQSSRLRARSGGVAGVDGFPKPGDGMAAERWRAAHVRRLTELLGEAEDAESVRQAALSIHALLNAATWTDASAGDPFRFDPCGLDAAFAETCCALAVALNQLREPLAAVSPALPRRIGDQLRRRMALPLAAEDAPRPRTLEEACLLLCAALLGVEGESARWALIRGLCADVDRALNRLPQDGSVPGGVARAASVAVLLADLAEVLRRSTEGFVDLTRHERVACMADYLLYAHIQGGYFFNPGECDMRARLDAEGLFRFGRQTGDSALAEMAAWLMHMGLEQPARTALSRALSRNVAAELDAAPGRIRLFRQGFLPDAGLMFMRGFQMCAVMHGGTDTPHADAGDVCLFWKDRPILVDAGGAARQTRQHSAAVVGGFGQLAPVPAAMTECAEGGTGPGGVACYTVSLAQAYPPEAHLADYQRTLLMGSEDAPGIRLLDMMDLTRPEVVEYHFICAVAPSPMDGGMRLGPVAIAWDAPLAPSVEPVEGTPLFNLTLRAGAAMRHRVEFEFIPA